MVLIIPQRCWYYADEANQFFEFMDSETGNTPDLRYHPLQNSTVCATDVTQARSPFLDLYGSPLSEGHAYRLCELDLPAISPRMEKAYSPEAIDKIFEDALPLTYSLQNVTHVRKDLELHFSVSISNCSLKKRLI